MEEVKGEDLRKSYPSLPPNYVSFVQLKERWIQQKQKEAAQKEQIDSSENQQQQPKEDDNNNNRFNGSPPRTNSKNGLGRIHAQGLPVRRNGELRVDADTVLVPRRQSDQNYGKIREGKGKWKSSSKVELQDSGLTGGSERGNAKDENLYRRKNRRRPKVKKKGLSEVDPAQTLSGNGVTSGGEEGYSSYENERVHETVSVCMVGLAPEIKGNEENPVSSSRKPPGKQVLDDQFPDSTDSLRVEGISLGKQVEDDQLFNASDSRIVEAKPCGQQPVNGQFLNNAGAEGSTNELEVLPKCVSVDEISGVRGRTRRIYKTKYGRYKRGGNDKGHLVEKNVFKQEVFRDNEEEEVSLGEKRITSKEKLESRFQGNGGNSRINRISNEIRLKQGQELVGEDISMAKEERTDSAARTGNGAQVYGNKNRVYRRLEKDFGDLSIQGGRKGNSSRGHRWRHGNLGTGLHRKGKQVVEDGLVWVKKGERPDSNSEIS